MSVKWLRNKCIVIFLDALIYNSADMTTLQPHLFSSQTSLCLCFFHEIGKGLNIQWQG